MGVPTLTLVGTTPTAGVGRAILSHVDLQPTFCAKDQQEFISKGLWCAERLEYLQDLRLTLRERFQKSALSQPVAVAGGLELAIRHAWRRWCADLPPVSFEVSHDRGQFGVNDPPPPVG
jgi:predicted O-linked N-acetylglucosamine transferase (SPINDLY family)